jgi:hypothetical protein
MKPICFSFIGTAPNLVGSGSGAPLPPIGPSIQIAEHSRPSGLRPALRVGGANRRGVAQRRPDPVLQAKAADDRLMIKGDRMTAWLTRQRPSSGTVQGIDRMVGNIQTGHFERSLAGLTAAGALVTAAEIYFEHDSASFGNKMMWVPVVLGPVGAVAGVAGFFSQRMAKTALPIASAAIVANGLQGVYLHARGISQKPGGWSNARYNLEMGPPLLAPLLVTMVGGMGLLAAILRREQ